MRLNATTTKPTSAQLELLDSFISNEGIYFEIIRDYVGMDLGTKVLYLERSITQDCRSLLRSLNKLFQPGAEGSVKKENIELIRAFKVINDLCFNNDVKYGGFGLRKTLQHYFSSLAPVNPEAFQEVIKETINKRIQQLSEGCEKLVSEQRSARETAEMDIPGHSGWRETLDVPAAQLPSQAQVILEGLVVHGIFQQSAQTIAAIIRTLNGALTTEQYQSLSDEVKQLIARRTDEARILIQRCGATFEQIQSLNAMGMTLLLNCLNEIMWYIHEGVTIGDLLAINNSFELSYMLRWKSLVEILVHKVNIPLMELLAMEYPVRQTLMLRTDEILLLINGQHITLSGLLALNQEALANLFGYVQETQFLTLEKLATLSDLLALEEPMRLVIRRNVLNLVGLLLDEAASFDQLTSLSVDDLNTVLSDKESEKAQNILQTIALPKMSV